MDENTTYNDSKSSILNLTGQGPSLGGVSPLEQEVLDEYERLSKNMKEAKDVVGIRRKKTDITNYPPTSTRWSISTAIIITPEHRFAVPFLGGSDTLAGSQNGQPNLEDMCLSSTLATLSSGPMTLEIAEGLRLLERKVASVYTLMKASVYSIVLQQGQLDGVDDEEGFEAGHDQG
ncbi:hypothetical protein LTR72_004608 [Exophiala xenobiotica]|nr:hypothetical protein LTR72_004608 [Exophiala xenobiotica]KAK5293909.1 hypothetical protein LTR14_004800 [Exophiala xenobiotica]KAK5496962.1 hypothetical protein LTR55_001452 [Exophiala xenobiotica]